MPTRVVADDDEQIIADLQKDVRRLRGRLATTAPRGGHDAWTAAATPATTYQLSTIPVSGTVEFVINGHEQREGTDYTVNYGTGLVTVSASLASGDKLVARYLVTDWLVARSLPPDVGVISDDFNRANNASTLGATPVGGLTWGYMTGTTWGVTGNQAYQPSGGGFATVDVGDANGIVATKLVTTNIFQGLCVRQSDDSHYWTVEAARLRKVNVGGSIVATWSTAVPGDVISVELNGNDFTVFINGVSVTPGTPTWTESFLNTATRHGIEDIGAASSSRWDDWSWTSL